MTKRVEKNEKITKKIEKKEKIEQIEKKGKKWLLILFLLLFLFFACFYYMRFIEPKQLRVKEIKLEYATFPESLSGLKLVHFSDLHYKTTIEEEDLKNLVNQINLLKPDIVVFTGDLLDKNISYTIEDYSTLSKNLEAIDIDISKYYVKGEEDYNNSNLEIIMKDAGFISLNNTSDIIYGNEQEWIQINGLGSELEQDFDAEAAFTDLSNEIFTITLLHEPDTILELTNNHIDLALAGHSHNSQINIPVLKEIFQDENAMTYYQEYYRINQTDFYINSGIGTNYTLKLRLFNPPTINLYRIIHKD